MSRRKKAHCKLCNQPIFQDKDSRGLCLTHYDEHLENALIALIAPSVQVKKQANKDGQLLIKAMVK